MSVQTRQPASIHSVETLALVEVMLTVRLLITGLCVSVKRDTMAILKLPVFRLDVSQTVNAKRLMLADQETVPQVDFEFKTSDFFINLC